MFRGLTLWRGEMSLICQRILVGLPGGCGDGGGGGNA